MAKKLPANAGDAGDAGLTPGLERWQPTPIFLSRKFHGQRSLASYSPWCHKELDMTKQLHE